VTSPRVFEPEYYARLADMERRHWWAIGIREIARSAIDRARKIDARTQWRVLDAGCGTGLTLEWVRRYTDEAPVGLDRSGDALNYCAARGHRRLVLGSATTLPFPGVFDLVLSNDVIQHLPRPSGDAAAFAEAVRVLRPGGWLFVRTNSQCGLGPADAADYHRYTLAEVRALARHAGLEIHLATYANCVPGLLATLRRWLARPAKTGGDPGLTMATRAPQESLVARVMLALLRIEASWIGGLGWSLPFGHSIVLLARRPGGAAVR